MKHEEIKKIALNLLDKIESAAVKTKHGHQRFYTMKEMVNGKVDANFRTSKLLMYGVYDYETKQALYFFTGPNEDDEANLKELAKFALVQ